ncbi:MAG: porin family protein [Bacteroidota bacterium]
MQKRKLITILIFGCILLWFQDTEAQRRVPHNLPKLDNQPAHFGYSLGLNIMDFTLKPSAEFFTFDTVYAVENRPYVGFNINMIANLRLMKYLDLRFNPGLNFGQRDLEYKLLENGVFSKHVMRIESTFLDFPFLLKYKAERYNNFRPFLVGGASVRYDLAAQKKIDPDDRPKIKLNPMDTYYEIGMGVDFFLEYFMFAVEVKGSFGMFNAVRYDNTEYTNYFEKLNSKMLIISFHFEGGKIDKISWFKD